MRFTNAELAQSFYRVELELRDDSRALLADQTLLPGMPVEVFSCKPRAHAIAVFDRTVPCLFLAPPPPPGAARRLGKGRQWRKSARLRPFRTWSAAIARYI